MRKFKDIPIKRKMIFVIVTSVLIPLSIAVAVIVLNASKFYRTELMSEATLSAKIIADFSVADILFNSQDISNKSLYYIGKNANFLRIVIFTQNGEIFSEYVKENHHKKHLMFRKKNTSYFDGGFLYTYQVIKQNSNVYGTICILSSTEVLDKRISEFFLGTILISFIIIVFAIYVGRKLAKNIIFPIENLVQKAEQITKEDSYGIRLNKIGDDEVGKLYDSLNIMLSKINQRRIERDAALSSLEISENNFKEIFHSSHDAIFIHDLDLSILDVNDTMLELYKLTRKEALKMSVKSDLSSIENNFDLINEYWNKVLNNIPQEFMWKALKPKTKEEFIVQVNLKKISLSDKEIVLATVRDITELTIANNELKNSENKLQKIFDILQVGIGLLRNREIIEVNNKTCDITGYSKVELIGEDKRKLYKSDEEFFNFGNIMLSDFSSKGLSRNEVEWIKKDGEIITVILDLMPLNFEVDGENLILFSILDITDLKKAESEIKELNADLENRVAERTRELELANKELEAFSYSVSHDLRTPLRGIREFSKIILEENMAQLDDDGKKYLLKVINYTIGMKHLIDDLLKLSKLSQEKIIFETINIEEIINSVINTLNDSMPLNKIKFVVNCKSNIVADPSLMRIMITNLNSNAVKFSSKIENPIIEFGMYDKNEANELFGINNIVFFIKDNGIGFDMKNADKLFTAFQRLHSVTEYEGLGIGLATVSRIIKKHGGKIWAHGKINEGATFFFTLSESTT